MPGRAPLGNCFRGGRTTAASRLLCSGRSGAGVARPGRFCGRPGGPRGAREARPLRGVDEGGDRGLGLGRGGQPRPAVTARPGPQPERGCGSGDAVCALAAVATHAVLCRGGPEAPGPTGAAVTALCVCGHKSARGAEGFAFSFPKPDRRGRAGVLLELSPPLCAVRK